jgi:ribosome-associated toxin RatA of RatAB toxin-antitoxin module
MHTITVKKFVNAPLNCVWESWDDFGRIERFHPDVSESRLLGDTSSTVGVGTRRECELTDGKNWIREQIVEYTPGKTLAVDVYESSLPVDSMRVTLRFRALKETRTEILLSAEFAARKGLVGKLMTPLLKRQYRPMLTALLNGNADYVENAPCARQAA